MKLHLGCGNRILPGFVNIDLRPMDGIDIVDDIVVLSQIDDCCANLIYACHVLEHVKRYEVYKTLKVWYSKLKSGGVLRLAVPDFEKVVYLYQIGVGCENLIGFLYGGQDYEYNFHHYCWDFNSLKRDLLVCGFTNVRRYDWRNTEHADIDDYSQSYYPHMQKDTGILMSLNVEADKI